MVSARSTAALKRRTNIEYLGACVLPDVRNWCAFSADTALLKLWICNRISPDQNEFSVWHFGDRVPSIIPKTLCLVYSIIDGEGYAVTCVPVKFGL